MIVCSCSGISERIVLEACDRLRARNRQTLLTPGRVYRELGLRMQCGCCMRLIVEVIHRDRAQIPKNG